MCGAAIISDFLPKPLYDLSKRECSGILQNDETLLRFGKRSRIASQSPCFSSTQLKPHSHRSSIYKLHPPHQHTGWSLNTEISNKRRENNCNNSGKRKLSDRNVNLADNLEYCLPTLTKGSNEEDSYETSDSSSYSSLDSIPDSSSYSSSDSIPDSSLDSSSDSETYSGPSGS